MNNIVRVLLVYIGFATVIGTVLLPRVAIGTQALAEPREYRLGIVQVQNQIAQPNAKDGKTLHLSPKDLENPLGLARRLMEMHWRAGRRQEALKAAEALRNLAVKKYGEMHNETAVAWSIIGHLNRQLGRHDAALIAYLKSYNVVRKTKGEESAQTAAAMINIAGAATSLRKFKDAEKLYLQGLAVLERVEGQNRPGLAKALERVGAFYWNQGRYGEAEKYLRRHLTITEARHGPRHNETIRSQSRLGELYDNQGRYDDAVALYFQALKSSQTLNGEHNKTTIRLLNSTATALRLSSRFAEAERLYVRAIKAATKVHGPKSPTVATLHNELGTTYRYLVRFDDAEKAFLQSYQLGKTAFGAVHKNQAFTLSNLGGLNRVRGKFEKAENYYERALVVLRKVYGPRHAQVGILLDNIGVLYGEQGRYGDAERVRKQALSILEEALGRNDRHVAIVLGNLADSYRALGRHSEAAPLLERALVIFSKSPSATRDPYVGFVLDNLGGAYRHMRRFTQAEKYIKLSVEFLKRAYGDLHPDVAIAISNLATLYSEMDKPEESERLHKQSIAMNERIFGPWHHGTATGLTNLAGLYQDLEQHGVSIPLLERALAISDKSFGPSHPRAVSSLASLGRSHSALGEWAKAFETYSRAARILVERAERNIDTQSDVGTKEVKDRAYVFRSLVMAAYALGESEPRRRTDLAGVAFTAAQWAGITTTAAALAQMSARFGAGDGILSQLVRNQQDLAQKRQRLDAGLIKAVSAAKAITDGKQAAHLRKELSAVDGKLSELTATLREKFPEYASLSSPRPMLLSDVQGALRLDEVLVKFVWVGRQGYVWAISRDDVRWHKISLSAKKVAEMVAALRCGLDDTEWFGETRPLRCMDLLGVVYDGTRLPFSLQLAHELYKHVLQPVEDMVGEKRLLIVPVGPLTSLPFHALLTAPASEAIPANASGYQRASWLAKRNAVTILPSVASLGALRKFARRSKASEPFIGYGDPVLSGSMQCPKVDVPSSCPDVVPVARLARLKASIGRKVASLQNYFRDGRADVTAVRSLCPLPDTAQELRCVAQSLGAPHSAVRLGHEANEQDIKQLSQSHRLDDYRVLHFATHGLLAGETQKMSSALAEPALVLTPPAQASTQNDGLLTASEVAELHLDADWVILSACNTGAGDQLGAEALSGLARAFFYAGARALLVSHWPVNSSAAVRLTTGTFAALKQEPAAGRAEALRRSIMSYVSSGAEWQAHPSFWAPFVIVGEGAPGF